MSTTINTGYVQPALVGGLVIGVLSALPIIYLGNLCCCLWIVSGGLVAAYLFQQNQAGPISPADGALVGLLAGLAGAVVHMVVSIPIDLLMAPLERAMLQRLGEMAGSMPPEMRTMLDRISSQSPEVRFGLLLVRRVIAFMLMVFVGSVFATLGGLLGSVLFVRKLPPGAIDAPSAS